MVRARKTGQGQNQERTCENKLDVQPIVPSCYGRSEGPRMLPAAAAASPHPLKPLAAASAWVDVSAPTSAAVADAPPTYFSSSTSSAQSYCYY